MWVLIIAIVFVSVFYTIISKVKNYDLEQLKKHYSHDLPTIPFLGLSYLAVGDNEVRMRSLQTIGLAAIRRGGVIAEWFGPSLYLIVADPEIATFILKSCSDKDDVLPKILGSLLGNGILVAQVPIWRTRRKNLVPTFNMKNLNKFVYIFTKHSEIMSEKLMSMVGTGPFSIFNHFAAYNMDSVSESVLGITLNAQEKSGHPFVEAFTEGFNLTSARMSQYWLYNDYVYRCVPSYKKLMRAKKVMVDFVKDIIVSKRKSIKEDRNQNSTDESITKSFLDMLIESSGGEEGYSDEELRDELMVLLVASIGTSAAGVGFTLIMLARHPEVQDKLYAELNEVFEGTCRSVTPEDLSRMKYLEIVIKESLRLYPPAPAVLRKVVKSLTLPTGVTVPAGCNVLINIWGIHHNYEYWGADAEQYRPERFLEGSFKHPSQYMPFSYGPRNCPGYQYALMSIKTTLATLLRRYRVLPPTDGDQFPPLRTSLEITLADAENFLIRLEPRQNIE
ncbi:cytochrome P450 4C1-like isoform X2 [Pectinophora gossypiella]|uniref:cytochrome P450 4C1-like isoform X2 n=1 Tax=Pectinophora gossypiella TaxID=13191 RepID=UPI00214E3FCE|nr:cytochrome P450 4C1-like isoform X2 [Pectinophora gossypiella]